MSNIKIYSKKAFAFGEGANRSGEIDMFTTVPNAFQEMPEKYVTDPTYKLAVVCGDVIPYPNNTVIPGVSSVIEEKTENKHEFDDSDDTQNNSNDAPVDNTAVINEFYEKLKIANKHETQEYAKQYGAEFIETDALKQNKKRVMEAFKLSIAE